jgi:hypothetical protein
VWAPPKIVSGLVKRASLGVRIGRALDLATRGSLVEADPLTVSTRRGRDAHRRLAAGDRIVVGGSRAKACNHQSSVLRNDAPPAAGFLLALQDTKSDGRADVKVRFGDSVQTGSAGGTGIALYRGALFAKVDDRIVRYALPATGIVPTEAPTINGKAYPSTDVTGKSVLSWVAHGVPGFIHIILKRGDVYHWLAWTISLELPSA